MVVVSSPAIAEECFTKNDIGLANRPRFIAGKYFGYNYTSLVGSPYGEHWRNLRRLTTVEIFSTARLNVFQSIRHDENKLLLKQLYGKSCQDFARVELRSMLSELTFNVIMRMVAGKRYFGEDEENDEEKQFREIMDKVSILAGVSNP
ncbi:UNVERIFIED_CONTAM: cytochrome [Sesamum angustifolium]|uniref:Cytochrome n=1 Tax=Sesamum angustifolium TaxID=2727405 RepID=A0AAW2MU09_9LAMI